MNYSNKNGYDAWKNDYIWLPSATEVWTSSSSTSNGLWDVSTYQKANYDGETLSIDGKIGVAGQSFSPYFWVRSAKNDDARYNLVMSYSGVGKKYDFSYYSYAIRPALHLNLKSVVESLEKENSYTLNYNYEIADEDYLQVGVYPTCMGVTDEFSLTNPVCSGYKFLGWRVENGLNSETAKYGTSSATESIVDENTECSVGNSKKMYFSGLGVSGGTVTLKALWQSTGEISVIYKSYNDYFTDYNISKSTITEDDLIGTGTSTDPYIVKTTKGFLYLTNKAVSGISLENKYVEINCDIVLNDEVFDSNGIPTSGDGIVYSWEPINNASSASIDGRGHTIYGLYHNNIESSNVALFGSKNRIAVIKNLNITNVYIKIAENGSAFAIYARRIENCHGYNGSIIILSGYAAGICINISVSINNCSNNINIRGSYCGGIVCYAGNDTFLQNLKNYGDVQAERVGGILTYVKWTRNLLRDCVNYGKLNGDIVGGLIATTDYCSGDCDIVNSSNYGVLECNRDVSICGGIIAEIHGGEWNLIDCANYGNIGDTGKRGVLFHGVNKSAKNVKLTISNFKAEINNFVPFFNYIATIGVELRANNIYYKTDLDKDISMYLVGETASNHLFKNVFINIKCRKFNSLIFRTNCQVENFYANIKCDDFLIKPNYLMQNMTDVTKGALINIVSKTSQVKHYYGTNFRNFYISYKYNTIGLSDMDGVSVGQGSISTTWLEENGWVKKG